MVDGGGQPSEHQAVSASLLDGGHGSVMVPVWYLSNIVIVAEGFRSSDMDVFRQSVATVAGRFLHLNLKIAIEFG